LGLTAPTHAFIGGSGGNLREILSALHGMNPAMRVVINAVSMETICEIKEIVSLYPVEDEDIVQVQVSRSKPAGRYHLMQAENPVWICAFNFKEESLDEI
jgi:precorrin-6Y C5,15-methyltransferase (decarboxylating)